MKLKRILFSATLCAAMTASVSAKTARPSLYVNEDVTTHILMPENIKLVDISTDRIAGDQCADNMLRIKPINDSVMMSQPYMEGQFLGIVTVIGERHMAQYDLLYTPTPSKSNAIMKVQYGETNNYANPEVPMTEAEMANYAWSICNSGRKFHTIRSKAYGIDAQVYNIYSIGNYFFIDLALENKTKIEYNIDQMRITLQDKKEVKATNSQTLELTPAFVLNNTNSFKKHYRQVLVLPKLTFPEEKILNIEITEDQISGRVVSIPVQYEDILYADCFDGNKSDVYFKMKEDYQNLNKNFLRVIKDLRDKQNQLDIANSRLNKLRQKLQKKSDEYLILEKKMEAMAKVCGDLVKLKEQFPVSLAESNQSDDIDTTDMDLMTISE